jgi:predicted DNA-binding transcriptional regulator AlpA
MISPVVERFITEQQLADMLGINLMSAGNLRKAGKGPRFYRVTPRRIAYRLSDIEAWLATREALAQEA